MTTPPEAARLRKLGIRAWRRGTKEMDLILGAYADARLGSMDAAALDAFEALLEVGDTDLYAWISRDCAPPPHAELVALLRDFHRLG